MLLFGNILERVKPSCRIECTVSTFLTLDDEFSGFINSTVLGFSALLQGTSPGGASTHKTVLSKACRGDWSVPSERLEPLMIGKSFLYLAFTQRIPMCTS